MVNPILDTALKYLVVIFCYLLVYDSAFCVYTGDVIHLRRLNVFYKQI